MLQIDVAAIGRIARRSLMTREKHWGQGSYETKTKSRQEIGRLPGPEPGRGMAIILDFPCCKREAGGEIP